MNDVKHSVKRDKYRTRSIILLSDRQKEIACAAIRNAPAGIECLLREPVKARSLDANSLYWIRLTEISAQAWFDGHQYSKDVWHIYCGKNIMPDQVMTKDGELRSKWEAIPGGGEAVISTTLMERRCFSEYIEAVTAFGASLGVHHSANPNEVGR